MMFTILRPKLSQVLCFLLDSDPFFFSFAPSLLILLLFLSYLAYSYHL